MSELRRLMMAKKVGGVPLPSGYRECEYLESYDGNQFIWLGYIPSAITEIEVTFMLSHTKSIYNSIFGTRNGGNNRFTLRFSNSLNDASGFAQIAGGLNAGYNQYALFSQNSAVGRKITIKMGNGKVYVDGVLTNTYNVVNTSRFTNQLVMFAINDGGLHNDHSQGIRIYELKITEGGNAIKTLIPCLDANGVPCYHDAVNNESLYSNKDGANSNFLYATK